MGSALARKVKGDVVPKKHKETRKLFLARWRATQVGKPLAHVWKERAQRQSLPERIFKN
jgi:hypothetical protein